MTYGFDSDTPGLRIPYFVTDVFTNTQFGGAPTGVCLLEGAWPDDSMLLNIADENALPETAFVLKRGDAYHIRWFAPNVEVDLCGHATVGAAAIMFEFVEPHADKLTFEWSQGQLTAYKRGDYVAIELPRRVVQPYALTDEMVAALGGAVPVETYASRDLVFVYESEEDVQNLRPDFHVMEKIEYGDGMIVTAKGNQSDFVVRAFFPKLATNEDPVCGSAHCNLIPYWSERLNKKELVSHQLSKRRGYLLCEDLDDRVMVAGESILYAIGEINIAQ